MNRDRDRNRDRSRAAAKPSDIPADWPNGSGVYREGTAHKKDDSGLMGRTMKRGEKHAAWVHRAGKYLYLGEYATFLRALQVIRGV